MQGECFSKLDKACIDGDNEELDEGQTSRFRSSALALLYLSNEKKKNGHSKHGTVVVYEVEKSDSVGDETVQTTSEICQGHRGHVNCV